MKNWNKGRFGFWFYTKNSMRKRDAVMARLMEAQGCRKERERIIKLFADSFEWTNDLIISRDDLIALISKETK